jgi:repressor LexA
MTTIKRPRGDTAQRILNFIQSESIRQGYPPTVREIGKAVGLKSTSTVHGHLRRLEANGLLRRDAMKTRAMEVISNDFFVEEKHVKTVPLLGKIAAGSPILAEECIDEKIPLPDIMTGEGDHFILAVRGDSMINAGIMDGDYVVVHRQKTAKNGDIVAAIIDGDSTVKTFYKENGLIRLQPENSTMNPIFPKTVEIAGKVVSLYRYK